MAVIGIDVGTIRVGVAIADPAVRIPFPVATWPRAAYEAEKSILRLIDERSATILVVGIPLNERGERTDICDMVEAFVRRIAKRATIAIEYIDEAFSSAEAQEMLRQGNKGAETIDAYAACVILNRYFERHTPKNQ
jgi:putative Holliday junction resolvase